MRLSQAVVPMMKQSDGSIVMINSVSMTGFKKTRPSVVSYAVTGATLDVNAGERIATQ